MSSLRALNLALLLVVAAFYRTCTAAKTPPPRFTAKKFANVAGHRMAYVEVGTGDPIVFVHGNPTSSFLWRNVLPVLEGRGRLIAPDLIGMGDSGKLPPGDPLRYSLLQHHNYLAQLLEQLGVKENVTLVLFDWGAAPGLLWAFNNRFNPSMVKAIAFMEAVVAPYESYDDFPPDLADLIRFLRTPAAEELVLQENFLVESVLQFGSLENLTKEEKEEYRRPFLKPGEGRRPTLTFPNQIPIAGEPADVAQAVGAYADWMRISPVPKLFIRADPGLILMGRLVEVVRGWANLTEITVSGLHFLPETMPTELGTLISDWLQKTLR